MTATDTTGRADAPAGYRAVKVTPGFDQFAKTDPSAEGPAWLTRCNAHSTTTPAANRKAGRALGAAAARATWCAKCKTAAAKTSAAK
jgi:hypothetical protein